MDSLTLQGLLDRIIRLETAVFEKQSSRGMHSFEKSPFYDKTKFAAELNGWSQAKIDYYWEQADLYSGSTGKKYKNWIKAVKNWDKMKPYESRGKPQITQYQKPERVEPYHAEYVPFDKRK